MAGYVVTGPLAVVHIEGKLQYLYQGAPVPEGVEAEEVERLAACGLLGKPEDVKPARAAAKPKAD
jgi:hypothetical protein